MAFFLTNLSRDTPLLASCCGLRFCTTVGEILYICWLDGSIGNYGHSNGNSERQAGHKQNVSA